MPNSKIAGNQMRGTKVSGCLHILQDSKVDFAKNFKSILTFSLLNTQTGDGKQLKLSTHTPFIP
jgi:hypothetical protein